MKSLSAHASPTGDYHVTISQHEPTAPPQTQFVRRGFRETDLHPPAAPDVDYVDNIDALGTIARLPLPIQAAFRRKVLAIVALQLFVVCMALVVIVFGVSSARRWIETRMVDIDTGRFVAAMATLALLLLLFLVRNVYPLNWVVLLLFTAAQVVCLAAADLALGASHVVLFNCGFACGCATFMVAMAGWTWEKRHDGGCCYGSRIVFAWLPTLGEYADLPRRGGAQLLSPIVIGTLAFLVASSVVLVLQLSHVVQWSSNELIISFFVQLLVSFWLIYEIHRMHETMTPDAYMGGVIYVYADLVAAIVALLALAVSILCVATTSEGAVFTMGGLSLVSDGCCGCCDSTTRTKVEEEDF